MIRIVVTFLVAFQSLVPPGMCLCQFVPCEVNSRSKKETAPATPASLTVSAAEPCCSCAAWQSAARTTATSPANRAASDREAPREHSCPHPVPGEPWPDCPVASAGPEARAVILPATEQVAPATAVHFVLLTDEVTCRRANRPDPFFTASAPPLFVRYCAFLI